MTAFAPDPMRRNASRGSLGSLTRVMSLAAVLSLALSRMSSAQGTSPVLVLPLDSVLRRLSPPVVLVHGGNATGDTWTPFASFLAQNGYGVIAPTLDQAQTIYTQSASLHAVMDNYGMNVPSVMIAAHSQGGLVSRALSRSQPVHALITIGTPHQGMAFAHNHDRVDFFLTMSVLDVLAVSQIVPQTVYGGEYTDFPNYDWTSLTGFQRRWTLQKALLAGGVILEIGVIYYNQRWGGLASWDELAQQSPFLQTLNANVSQEQIGTAYSILSQAGDGYAGGPLRLIASGSASDYLGFQMYELGFRLQDDAYLLVEGMSQSPTSWEDYVAAASLFDLADRAQTFGLWWTTDIVEGFPHDGLVVTANQLRPGSVSFGVIGSAHTEETRSARTTTLIKDLLDQNRR
jgi:pimeloyl-ACP methyl ester carboxylesterase